MMAVHSSRCPAHLDPRRESRCVLNRSMWTKTSKPTRTTRSTRPYPRQRGASGGQCSSSKPTARKSDGSYDNRSWRQSEVLAEQYYCLKLRNRKQTGFPLIFSGILTRYRLPKQENSAWALENDNIASNARPMCVYVFIKCNAA